MSGTIQNSGSQTATNIRVIGTFYNASGTVVAVGYIEYLTPIVSKPSSVASFKVGSFNHNQTEVPSNKKSQATRCWYRSKSHFFQGRHIHFLNPTRRPQPLPDSTPSHTITPETQIIAVVVEVILVILVSTILVLNKRKAKVQTPKNHKSQML